MKKTLEDIKKVFDSKIAFRILFGIGIVIVTLLIFFAGLSVGFHKASFEHAWEENYERNFGIKPEHYLFGGKNLPNAHGAIGKIIKIELPTLIVQDRDNTEKIVLIKDDTQIQKMRKTIASADLKIDDFVVVIGSPNPQGQVEAKFIRVMPFGMPVSASEIPTPTQ